MRKIIHLAQVFGGSVYSSIKVYTATWKKNSQESDIKPNNNYIQVKPR